MVIGEIMTKDPVSATTDTTVAQALSMLHDLDVRHLPIVDGGELVGIISDRDVRSFADIDFFDEAAQAGHREKLRTPVSEIMAGDIATVDPESEVNEAIDIMLEERVGAVMVVDRHNQNLVGIVSYIDVLRALRDKA